MEFNKNNNEKEEKDIIISCTDNISKEELVEMFINKILVIDSSNDTKK